MYSGTQLVDSIQSAERFNGKVTKHATKLFTIEFSDQAMFLFFKNNLETYDTRLTRPERNRPSNLYTLESYTELAEIVILIHPQTLTNFDLKSVILASLPVIEKRIFITWHGYDYSSPVEIRFHKKRLHDEFEEEVKKFGASISSIDTNKYLFTYKDETALVYIFTSRYMYERNDYNMIDRKKKRIKMREWYLMDHQEEISLIHLANLIEDFISMGYPYNYNPNSEIINNFNSRLIGNF